VNLQKRKKKLRESTLLRNLEAREEKVKRLIEKDPMLAEAFLQEKSLEQALARASGEKVIDSRKAIQNSMKRNKKRKEKSATLWRERKSKVKTDAADRQQKRTNNIKEQMKKKKKTSKK